MQFVNFHAPGMAVPKASKYVACTVMQMPCSGIELSPGHACCLAGKSKSAGQSAGAAGAAVLSFYNFLNLLMCMPHGGSLHSLAGGMIIDS